MKKDQKKSKPTDTEEFNGSLFELSPDPVIILQDWKFVKVSPSFLKTFGVTQSQIDNGLSMPDFIPEEDLEHVRKRYEERIIGKKKLSDLFVFKAYKPSGEIVHLQATSASIEYNGKPAILSIVRDVTEQNRKTLEQKEAERLQSKLTELSPDPIVIIQDKKFSYVSPAFFSVFGYNQKDIDKGLSYNKFLSKAELKRVNERVTARLKGEVVPELFELEAVKKDGSLIQLEARSKKIEYRGEPAVLTILRDVSERVLTEEALRESEEYLKTIAEQSPNIIFIQTKDKMVFVSNNSTDTIGYTPEELTSDDFDTMDGVAPESRKAVIETTKRVFEGEEVPTAEYKMLHKDGSIVDIICTTKLISYQRQPALLGIMTNVSDLKLTRAKLADATRNLSSQKNELEDKNAALKEILMQIENEKLLVKKQISRNIDQLLRPILSHLKKHSSASQARYFNILEETLNDLVSEFGIQKKTDMAALSPKQMEICNMIRSGMPSKEISDVLGVSLRTVEVHRNNIRKKLGLSGKDVNLVTFLKENE